LCQVTIKSRIESSRSYGLSQATSKSEFFSLQTLG